MKEKIKDINYKKVIENSFEKQLYMNKHDEVLHYLEIFGSSDFFTIVKNVGGSDRRMMRLINQMIECGELVVNSNKFDIPNNYNKYKDINYLDITNKIKTIIEERPLPTFLFDQRPVTYKTTVNRVKYMLSRNDIYKKNIVFLGDDDLTSIALALSSVECHITVLDIDERLINYIKNVNKKYNLNIEARVFNALDDVSFELLHQFDVLATDPTPEKIPFTVFMNTALNLLKGKNSIIYTSIYSSAMDESLDLQKVLNKMNLYVTDMIPGFTNYKALYNLYSKEDIEFINKYKIKIDDDSMCFTETLFRIKVTDSSKIVPIKYKGNNIFGKATKRAIKGKDYLVHDNYLDNVKNELINSSNTEYISK